MPKKTKKAKIKAQLRHAHLLSPLAVPPASINAAPKPSKLGYTFTPSSTGLSGSTGVLTTPHFPALKRDLIYTLILSGVAIFTELIIAWKVR